MGQEPRVLARDAGAARSRAGADARHQPAALAHARPAARRRPPGPPGGDHQLRQRRGVGPGRGGDRQRRGRRPDRSRPSGCRTSASARPCCPRCAAGSGCSWSTRRTASATGATTSGRTTGASAGSSRRCPSGSRSSRPPPPRTTASSPTSSSSSAWAWRSSAGRSPGPACGSRRSSCATAPSAWPGSPSSCPAMPGNGIVYCLTIADCERVASWLRSQGIEARAYHAQLLPDERVRLEDDLLANRVKTLVASTALGMGFDKPDLGFVIHFQRPGSVIAYYQQVGRAGRALDDAYGVLLSGREDDEYPGLLHRQRVPARHRHGSRHRRARRHRRDVDLPAGDRAQPPALADPEGAHAARDRRRHRARRRPLPADRHAVRAGPRADGPDHRAAPGREARDARVPPPPGLPDGVPDSRARRPRPEAVRPMRARARRALADDGRPRAGPGGDRAAARVRGGHRAAAAVAGGRGGGSQGAHRESQRGGPSPRASRATPAGAGK